MRKAVVEILFTILLLITQILAVVFYGVYHTHIFSATDPIAPMVVAGFSRYAQFQDIHVMVFVGMAFLFVFLKRFKLSALTQAFWVAALSVQYYFLWRALWEGAWLGYGDFYTWTPLLIKGEYCAFAMLIALGAILGKANNFQILLIMIVGIMLFPLNEQILFTHLDVSDIGGSMYIFAFGGFFGLGATWALNYANSRNNINYTTNINSNTLAMIGTLFLWVFWPSFNSASAANDLAANVAIVNTYFCLIGSVMGAYFLTTIIHKGKFHMEHILNATLVGGVLMGAGADLLLESFVAYIVGGLGGIVSALLYTYGSRMIRRMGIYDTAGVTFLFAIPGMIGGLLSAIYRARYFSRGGIQVAGTGISIGIGFGGGLIIGLIARFFSYYGLEDEYYNDLSNVYFDDVADQAVTSRAVRGKDYAPAPAPVHPVNPAQYASNENRHELGNFNEHYSGV